MWQRLAGPITQLPWLHIIEKSGNSSWHWPCDKVTVYNVLVLLTTVYTGFLHPSG